MRGAQQREEAVRGAEAGGLRDLHELLAVRLEQPVEHRRLLASPISAQVSPSSAIAVNQNMSRGIAANSSRASSRNCATPACVSPDIRCAIGRIARQANSAGFSLDVAARSSRRSPTARPRAGAGSASGRRRSSRRRGPARGGRARRPRARAARRRRRGPPSAPTRPPSRRRSGCRAAGAARRRAWPARRCARARVLDAAGLEQVVDAPVLAERLQLALADRARRARAAPRSRRSRSSRWSTCSSAAWRDSSATSSARGSPSRCAIASASALSACGARWLGELEPVDEPGAQLHARAAGPRSEPRQRLLEQRDRRRGRSTPASAWRPAMPERGLGQRVAVVALARAAPRRRRTSRARPGRRRAARRRPARAGSSSAVVRAPVVLRRLLVGERGGRPARPPASAYADRLRSRGPRRSGRRARPGSRRRRPRAPRRSGGAGARGGSRSGARRASRARARARRRSGRARRPRGQARAASPPRARRCASSCSSSSVSSTRGRTGGRPPHATLSTWLAVSRELRQAARDHLLDALGHGDPAQRALLELGQAAQRLLDEERVAVGLLGQPAHELRA